MTYLVNNGLVFHTPRLACTDLDRHTGQVESHGEQGLLAQHPLETTSKLDLADGKSVSQVERSVHVGVRESSHPLGLLSSDLGRRRSLAGDRLEVGTSGDRRIDLE